MLIGMTPRSTKILFQSVILRSEATKNLSPQRQNQFQRGTWDSSLRSEWHWAVIFERSL